MATNIFELFGKIIVDNKTANKAIDETVQKGKSADNSFTKSLSNIGKGFISAGKSMSSVGSSLTSKITKPAFAAAGALTGITLVKGFNRLTGIDDAKAKLLGLGHSGESVTEIMNSALTSVKGTSYGLDEAATTAASAVAAGIKPGQELTRYLSLTADAAAIAGVSMSDMGSIINKVQTAQVAYTDDLNQLADRGIPIYQWLAEEAGVTAGEVKNLASDGKISSEMFLNAIEKNIGGAAKIMGANSFKASIANIGASIGRIGANFLDAGGKGGGFFSTLKPLLVEFNDWLGNAENKAADLGVKFGEAFQNVIQKVRELKEKFDGLSPSMQQTILKAVGIGSAIAVGLGPALKIIGPIVSGFGHLLTAVSGASGALSAIGGVIAGISAPVAIVVAAVVALGAAFVDLWKNNEDFRNKIIEIWTNIKETISEFCQGIVDRLNDLGFNFEDIIDVIRTAWEAFTEVLAPVFIAAFEIISSTLDTVLGVITGILDVFIGVFTGDWSQAWEGIKTIFSSIWDGVKSYFGSILDGIIGIANVVMGWFGTSWNEFWQGIADFFGGIWDAVKTKVEEVWTGITTWLSETWTSISTVATTVFEVIKNIITVAFMTVQSVLEGIWLFITSMLQTAWNLIASIATAIWEPIKAYLSELFNPVITVFQTLWTAITIWLSTKWEEIKTNATTIFNAIASFLSGIWQSVSTTAQSVWNTILSVLSGIWNTISSTASSIFNSLASVLSTVWNAISSTAQSVWSTLSSVLSGIWNSISSTASSVFNSLSSTLSGIWNGIKSTASSVWNGIKDAMIRPIEAAKDTISRIIDTIKGFFNNLRLKLPKIEMPPLPHFSLSGSFSLNPPSVPHLSVDWYAKGGLMTEPTLFGMSGNSLLGGGEAGPEAILPLNNSVFSSIAKGIVDQFKAMNDSSVSSTTLNDISDKLQQLLVIFSNMNPQVVLDSGELVGSLISKIDFALGELERQSRRGN